MNTETLIATIALILGILFTALIEHHKVRQSIGLTILFGSTSFICVGTFVYFALKALF